MNLKRTTSRRERICNENPLIMERLADMKYSYMFRCLIFLMLLYAGNVFLFVSPAVSQNPGGNNSPRKSHWNIAASGIYQSPSHLDSGGSFSVSRYWLRIDGNTSMQGPFNTGLTFSFDFDDYDFSNATAYGGTAPWDNVQRFGLGIPLRYRIKENWHLALAPSVEFSKETSAGWEDALIYGGFVALSHQSGRKFRIGGGLGIYSGLEETSIFPYLVVFWQITDDLRLSNPFRVGPAGPAGLELAWRLDRNWELGTGGAYRSFRFRLDETGFAPNGIGKSSFLPVWGRISRKLGPVFMVDVYAGLLFDGKLKIENQNGNEMVSDEYDTAALFSLTVSARF